MSAASGRFVWFDLMTPDTEGAKAFYGALINWTTTKWSSGDYEMWTAGKEQVGGLMALPEAGAPPHWLGYVASEDVDAAVKRVEQLGGKVHRPPSDIPEVGRFAVVADPQGAVFALFKSSTPQAVPEMRKPGHVGWAELNTTDWKSAWRFYSELLGWKKVSSMDMGPGVGEYFMFGDGGEPPMLGGMSDAAKAMNAPPHWLFYFNVKSVDAAAARIPSLGGKVLNGPMDVPGGDRIAQGQDPRGAMFAIYSFSDAR